MKLMLRPLASTVALLALTAASAFANHVTITGTVSGYNTHLTVTGKAIQGIPVGSKVTINYDDLGDFVFEAGNPTPLPIVSNFTLVVNVNGKDIPYKGNPYLLISPYVGPGYYVVGLKKVGGNSFGYDQVYPRVDLKSETNASTHFPDSTIFPTGTGNLTFTSINKAIKGCSSGFNSGTDICYIYEQVLFNVDSVVSQ